MDKRQISADLLALPGSDIASISLLPQTGWIPERPLQGASLLYRLRQHLGTRAATLPLPVFPYIEPLPKMIKAPGCNSLPLQSECLASQDTFSAVSFAP